MFQSGCTTKVKGQAGIYPVACGSGRSLCRWQHLYAPSGVSLGSGLPATGIRVAIFHDTASTFLLLKLKLYFNWFVLTNFSLSQLVKAQRYEALTMTEQRWPWEFRGITSLFLPKCEFIVYEQFKEQMSAWRNYGTNPLSRGAASKVPLFAATVSLRSHILPQ